jgi:hypothetical protein
MSLNLKAIPVQTYGFQYGSSASENAVKMMEVNATKQNDFNNSLAGGGKRRFKKHKMRGGNVATIEIPQFPQMGPQVGPQNGNSAAFAINKVLIDATNNGANDNQIGKIVGSQKGGTHKRKKRMSNKSFKLKRRCRSLKCMKLSKHRKHRKHRKYRKYKTKKI